MSDEQFEPPDKTTSSEHASLYNRFYEVLRERDELRHEVVMLRGNNDALEATLKTSNDELSKALAEVERLKKERTTYKTLDALLSDNGQICELYDDIEALEVKLAIARKELEFYDKHHHCLNTTSPNFAREALEKIK